MVHMGVSKNNGTPKSSILIGFSIINHPFWGTFIFGNVHVSHHRDYRPKNPVLSGTMPVASGVKITPIDGPIIGWVEKTHITYVRG